MSKIFTRVLALCGLLHLMAGASPADVIDSSSHGFTVRSTVVVNASAARAYQVFVDDIGKWWNPEHTYSGNSWNLSVVAEQGGCFCEKPANGGFVQHLQVVYAEPGRMLRMSGGLGPLQQLAVSRCMTISFVEKESTTEVTMSYAVGGYLKEGLNTWASAIDGVLSEQLNRFRAFIDR